MGALEAVGAVWGGPSLSLSPGECMESCSGCSADVLAPSLAPSIKAARPHHKLRDPLEAGALSAARVETGVDKECILGPAGDWVSRLGEMRITTGWVMTG